MKKLTKLYYLDKNFNNIFITVFIWLLYLLGGLIYSYLIPSADEPILRLATISFLLLLIFACLVGLRKVFNKLKKSNTISILSITTATQALFNISFVFTIISFFFLYGQKIGNYILDANFFIILLPILYYSFTTITGIIYKKKLTSLFLIALLVLFILPIFLTELFDYTNILFDAASSLIFVIGMIITPNIAKYSENWFPIKNFK